jgi:hypothetical protein
MVIGRAVIVELATGAHLVRVLTSLPASAVSPPPSARCSVRSSCSCRTDGSRSGSSPRLGS